MQVGEANLLKDIEDIALRLRDVGVKKPDVENIGIKGCDVEITNQGNLAARVFLKRLGNVRSETL